VEKGLAKRHNFIRIRLEGGALIIKSAVLWRGVWPNRPNFIVAEKALRFRLALFTVYVGEGGGVG